DLDESHWAGVALDDRRVGSEGPEVGPRRKDLLVRGGEHQAPSRLVVATGPKRLDQLVEELRRQRVPRVGVVEGDGGDAVVGYLGLCFPEEYGGQGGDYFYSLVRAECMSYSGSGGTNMGFAVQTDMVLPPVHLLGTEEQRQRFLVPGIRGERIGCLGITEPGA